MSHLLKYKITLIGIIVGSIGGYLYYFYMGCASDTCAITSKPFNSSIYGALMGGLLFNLFESKTTNNHNAN